jgi:hypothetical protein
MESDHSPFRLIEAVGQAGTSEKEGVNVTATATSQLNSGTWAIDPVHSSINFSVRHLRVSKVRDKFERFGGAIVVGEDGMPSDSDERQAKGAQLDGFSSCPLSTDDELRVGDGCASP